ncbi:hypothetical protein Tco_0641175, partial [Tanacetum coccineum]
FADSIRKIVNNKDPQSVVDLPYEMLIPDSDDHDGFSTDVMQSCLFSKEAILAPTHDKVD